MRTKSAYRKFRDGGAVLMAEEIAPAPIAVPTDAGIDDASLAFKDQIGKLHQAEEAQRLRATAPPPTGRSAQLNQLRHEGLSEAAISFLSANHDIMDTPQLADQAARAAREEGHEPDSPGFFESVRSNFHRIVGSAEEKPPEAMETAKKYSGGASKPSLHQEASLERDTFNRQAAMVSAPVSREVPTSSREDRGISNRVTLSAAELSIARSMGISDVDYARGKLDLERRKRAGEL